ncbi:Mur ligase family protein [Methyloprofundus sp.]|uniref:Mur ligase family protein n=1 Tax=Methyloprofundus sp. TaxID=2020875 RepID=UPI003D0B0A8D
MTEKTPLTSEFHITKRPQIIYKKDKSSLELLKQNREHNFDSQLPSKRERLSLKSQQSKVHIKKHSLPIKLAPNRHPSKDLYVIGITGTNGKTSVAYLIAEVLKSAGYKPFVLGTLNSENKGLSTPDSDDVKSYMQDHLDRGGTHFIMEVTSEGIDQTRMLDIDFNIKLLTNITEDHLDYHKTFEKYQQAKLGFMREGTAHTIYPQTFKKEPINFTTKLLGHFNCLNIKAAASVLRHINISENNIQKTLSSFSFQDVPPPEKHTATINSRNVSTR